MTHAILHSFLQTGYSLLVAQLVATSVILALALIACLTLRERLGARTRRDMLRTGLCLSILPVAAVSAFFDAIRSSKVIPIPVSDYVPTLWITVTPTSGARESESLCIFAGVWIVGTFSLIARALIQHHRLMSRLALDGSPVEDMGLGPFSNAVGSTSVSAPITIGFFRSRLVVPADFLDCPRAERDAVLLHEEAHAKHRDNAWEFLLTLISSALWFHPLAWAAMRAHAQSREECCDEAALDALEDPAPYFNALARFASRARTVNVIASGFESAKLSVRVQNATTYLERRSHLMKHRTVTTICLFLGVFALAASALPAADAPTGATSGDEMTPYAITTRLVQFHPTQFQLDVEVIERATGKPALAPRLFFQKGQDATIFSENQFDASKFRAEVKNGASGEITLHFVASRDNREIQNSVHPLESTYVPRAIATRRVDPAYTEEAKSKRVQGIVIVQTAISSTGEPGDVKVLKRLPFGLDTAAVESIRQWQFKPALDEAGNPIDSIQNITIEFRLDDEQPE